MDTADRLIEKFEQRSRTTFNAIDNIVNTAHEQQKSMRELLSSLAGAQQKINQHTRWVEIKVDSSIDRLDDKVGTAVSNLVNHKLADVNSQLDTSVLKLTQAAEHLRRLMMGALITLAIVATLAVVTLTFLVPSKATIEQRSAELARLNREIELKGALAHATISQCDKKPCIRINLKPEYTHAPPAGPKEDFRLIWQKNPR